MYVPVFFITHETEQHENSNKVKQQIQVYIFCNLINLIFKINFRKINVYYVPSIQPLELVVCGLFSMKGLKYNLVELHS